MPEARCICELIPRLELRTRLLVAFHRREWSKTTNTGHLAARAVAGSVCALWGDGSPLHGLDGQGVSLPAAASGRAFVLTPTEAEPLERARLPAGDAPLWMVVPDGTWRQASKMPRRIPELADLPRFCLPDPPEAPGHLRKTERVGGLATLHAVALALGVIEGKAVEEALMRCYEAMVRATAEGRGPLRRACWMTVT